MLSSGSPKTTPPVPASPDFPPTTRPEWNLGQVTVSASETPAVFVLLDAADQVGVSVVPPPEAEKVLVTVDYRDADAQAVFEQVGELIGRTAVYQSGVVTFTTSTAAAAMAVFRNGHEATNTVVHAMQSVVGQEAKVVGLGSRIIVAGKDAHINAAAALAPYLAAGPDGWRLDVRVVSITDSFRRELGIDWDVGASATLALGGSTGDLAPVLTGTSASVLVRAVASATQSTREAHLLHSATLYVLEDGEATMLQGDRTPIPRYQTSPEGTTTLIGFDYVETGFALTASARRVDGGVRLQLEPRVSAVTGFVETAPIITESRVTAQAVMASGEWLAISGLSTRQTEGGTNSLPGLASIGRKASSASEASVLYLVRAERVYASRPAP